jgi:WD40 repeat protein
MPNSKLASFSLDCTLKIWNAKNGKYITTLPGHKSIINHAIVLSNGQLVTCGVDAKVIIWNTSGNVLNRAEVSPKHVLKKTCVGHVGSVFRLCEMPNGLLASGGADGTVRLWDVGSGECVKTLKGHVGAVLDVVCLGKGRVASAGADGTVKIWSD